MGYTPIPLKQFIELIMVIYLHVYHAVLKCTKLYALPFTYVTNFGVTGCMSFLKVLYNEIMAPPGS